MSDFTTDLIFILIVLLGSAVLGILIGYVFGLIQKKKATQVLEETIRDLQNELLRSEKKKKEIEIEWANEKEGYARNAEVSEKDLAMCKDEMEKVEIQTADIRIKSEKRIADLETELSTFQQEKEKLSRRTEDLMKALAEVKEEAAVADKEPVIVKKAPKVGSTAYNLKIIEGIGPKIEQILKEAGIDTWVKLSMANPDEIRSILISKGGSTYRIHDPRTWPYQAKLASEGLWKDLKSYQDTISGGKLTEKD